MTIVLVYGIVHSSSSLSDTVAELSQGGMYRVQELSGIPKKGQQKNPGYGRRGGQSPLL